MRTKRIARLFALALAWLALACGLLLYAGEIKRCYTGVGVRMADASVSKRTLVSAATVEDDSVRLTAAWRRGKAVTATAETLGTTVSVRPVAVYGDIRQVCPMRLLSGAYLPEDDTAGCLLASDAAMALFHGAEAVGARVLLAGKRYTVRGVVDAYEPLAIVRSDATSYDSLALALSDLSNGAEQANAFLYRHGLAGDAVTIESGLYAHILYGLAFLPVAFLCLVTAVRCAKAGWVRRKSPASLCFLLPALGALLLAAFILRCTFYWPQGYLPTKCADFAYWGKLFTTWRESWKAMTLAAPQPADIQFYAAARRIVCGVILLFALEGCLDRSLPQRTQKTAKESTRETIR